jgi:hypothetical protein
MNKVYNVSAFFEDMESSSYILIGNFLDKKTAIIHKKKWDQFFKSSQRLLDEPENWIPENDRWFNHQDFGYGFNWFDSEQYHVLLSKYGFIKSFNKIVIDKLPLNSDNFINNIMFDDMKNIMLKFDRDWKLKQLTQYD